MPASVGGGSDGDLHGRADLEGMRTKGVTPGAEFRGPVVVTVAPCWPLWERGRSPGLAGPRGVGAAGKRGAMGDAPSAGQCGGPRSKPFPAPATHVLPAPSSSHALGSEPGLFFYLRISLDQDSLFLDIVKLKGKKNPKRKLAAQ